MYLLINYDNTLNCVGEHPVDLCLCFDDVTLVEHPVRCSRYCGRHSF